MSACVLWHGGTVGGGYGRVSGGRLAHRHVWMECFGPIPAGLVVHHVCEVKLCVNPEHLRLLTPGDHMRLHDNAAAGRGKSGPALRARTHCKHGHEFTPANTYVREHGYRQCRACDRARHRRPA